MDRRDFLRKSAVASFAASLNPQLSRASDQPVPRRTLGRTGEKVSIIGIGGYHLGAPSVEEGEAIRIVRTAIDNGVNFLDNCWDYNNGVSEERMGKALRDGYRQKAFLMTKIDGRTKAAAAQQIDESLKRLQTDRIDLLQFHEVIRDNDPERQLRVDRGQPGLREEHPGTAGDERSRQSGFPVAHGGAEVVNNDQRQAQHQERRQPRLVASQPWIGKGMICSRRLTPPVRSSP